MKNLITDKATTAANPDSKRKVKTRTFPEPKSNKQTAGKRVRTIDPNIARIVEYYRQQILSSLGRNKR